jgi:hypothetical protein
VVVGDDDLLCPDYPYPDCESNMCSFIADSALILYLGAVSAGVECPHGSGLGAKCYAEALQDYKDCLCGIVGAYQNVCCSCNTHSCRKQAIEDFSADASACYNTYINAAHGCCTVNP